MTTECTNFIRAVIAQDWAEAYRQLNGLNMAEMLLAMRALDRLDLDELWAQRTAIRNLAATVNLPRIEYARSVVVNRRLPATAPGDLRQTGQVTAAQHYVNHPRERLAFTEDLTGNMPAFPANPPTLSEQDFVNAAAGMRCEVAAIMAVARVEAGGRTGFDGNRPIIRYELHKFHQRTRHVYDTTHPYLSQPTLAAGRPYHTRAQSNEWSLIFNAMILRDAQRTRRHEAAWWSTSWGMFQVMGFNHAAVGWAHITDFVTAMCESEAQQLSAFVGFCRTNNLIRHIQARDWASFAATYNGSDYRVNNYDTNMATHYAAISAQRRRQRLPP